MYGYFQPATQSNYASVSGGSYASLFCDDAEMVSASQHIKYQFWPEQRSTLGG